MILLTIYRSICKLHVIFFLRQDVFWQHFLFCGPKDSLAEAKNCREGVLPWFLTSYHTEPPGGWGGGRHNIVKVSILAFLTILCLTYGKSHSFYYYNPADSLNKAKYFRSEAMYALRATNI